MATRRQPSARLGHRGVFRGQPVHEFRPCAPAGVATRHQVAHALLDPRVEPEHMKGPGLGETARQAMLGAERQAFDQDVVAIRQEVACELKRAGQTAVREADRVAAAAAAPVFPEHHQRTAAERVGQPIGKRPCPTYSEDRLHLAGRRPSVLRENPARQLRLARPGGAARIDHDAHGPSLPKCRKATGSQPSGLFSINSNRGGTQDIL